MKKLTFYNYIALGIVIIFLSLLFAFMSGCAVHTPQRDIILVVPLNDIGAEYPVETGANDHTVFYAPVTIEKGLLDSKNQYQTWIYQEDLPKLMDYVIKQKTKGGD